MPLAYAAFALVLGIAAGTLLRSTVPSMVAALAGFVALRLPVSRNQSVWSSSAGSRADQPNAHVCH
jgi:hypothetical protein